MILVTFCGLVATIIGLFFPKPLSSEQQTLFEGMLSLFQFGAGAFFGVVSSTLTSK
jgi:hypothetical protein